MELNESLILLIGLIATVIAQVIKFILMKSQSIKIHRGTITAILYIISFIFAALFMRPSLPVFPVLIGDPAVITGAVLTFIGQWVALLSAISGFAVLVYNLLMEKVFEQIGLTDKIIDPVE